MSNEPADKAAHRQQRWAGKKIRREEVGFTTALEGMQQAGAPVSSADSSSTGNASPATREVVPIRTNDSVQSRTSGSSKRVPNLADKEEAVLRFVFDYHTRLGDWPWMKHLLEGTNLSRTNLFPVLDILENTRGEVKRLSVGNQKIIQLTKQGRERAALLLATQAPSPAGGSGLSVSPAPDGSVGSGLGPASRGGMPMSGVGVGGEEGVPGVGGSVEVPIVVPPRAAPGGTPLGPGNPVGVGVRKHRLKLRSSFVFRGSMRELLASGVAGAWTRSDFNGQARLILSKEAAGTGCAVHVMWGSGQQDPGMVEGTILWMPGDVYARGVYEAEVRVMEVLDATSRRVQQLLLEGLEKARTLEQAKARGRDESLFVTRNPKLWPSSDRPTIVERSVFSVTQNTWVPYQGEIAFEENTMARKFREAGVSQAWGRHMGHDGSKHGNDLEFYRAETGPVDAATYYEQQEDLFLHGGYERDQQEHRVRSAGLEARGDLHRVEFREDMRDVAELLKLDLMERIQSSKNLEKRVGRLEQLLEALAEQQVRREVPSKGEPDPGVM